MNVNIFGQMNVTGVGRHIDNLFFALVRNRPAGVMINYVDPTRESSVRRMGAGVGSEDATIFLWRIGAQHLAGLAGRKIVWPYFESDRLPVGWVQDFAAYDEVWSPTRWGRDVLLAHGLAQHRVKVVEAGVNPAIFHPQPVAHEGFVFLSVGKYENRKSIDEIVRAFCAEFPRERNPHIRLNLKADYPLYPQRVAQLRARVAEDGRIDVVSGNLSDQAMARLYNGADAFVFPSKSEGFGLPCIEALACGLPVIATAYSGQATFLERIPGLFRPVEYRIAPLVDEDYARFYARDYGGADFGRWAIPVPESLRQSMREVYDDAASWRARADRASKIIRDEFSWDVIARKSLTELRNREPLSNIGHTTAGN